MTNEQFQKQVLDTLAQLQKELKVESEASSERDEMLLDLIRNSHEELTGRIDELSEKVDPLIEKVDLLTEKVDAMAEDFTGFRHETSERLDDHETRLRKVEAVRV